MTTSYKREFYEGVEVLASNAAETVVPLVLEYIQPRSVIDVGCGSGAWLAAFASTGISHILGLDGPWVDVDLLKIPKNRFTVTDLTKPVVESGSFDLVLSLEVAEHLPPEAADTLVDSLTSLGSVILFSAAIPYQGGTRHLNERWPSYWVPKFAQRGFVAVDCLRPRLWDNRTIAFYYSQNMYFLVHESGLRSWPKIAEASVRLGPRALDLVHPRLYLQSTPFTSSLVDVTRGALAYLRDSVIPHRKARAEQRRGAARWPVR